MRSTHVPVLVTRTAATFNAVLIVTLILAATVLGVSAKAGAVRADEAAAQVAHLRVEIAEQRTVVEMQQSEITSLKQLLADATATVAAVQEDNASLAESLTAESRRANAAEARLRERVEPSLTDISTGGASLSRTEMRRLLTAAAKRYGITGADRDWLVSAGLRIAWGESRYNPKARSGEHLGLFQFNAGWKGTRAQKLDATWSARRFARVFRDGGKRAIRRHWAATI